MFHTYSRLDIQLLDDPERPIRLIRVVGPIGHMSIERLVRSWEHLTAPHAVHVDLADAQIDDVRTMQRLEAALDHLEQQRIDVRVVGIDPSHPALCA